MVSVVMPTLDEAELLPGALSHIKANPAPHEILVVDGGSGDGTVKLAEAGGARISHSPQRQRAFQMNLGARRARGEIFLFLHADTWIGPNALGQIEEALGDPTVVGGGFARRFQSRSFILRFTCVIGGWRSRWLGWFYGDQGIFVRRTIFERLGGFRDIPIFEDVDFSRRMAQAGHVVTLRSNVVSSARRFASRGAFLTTASDVWLTLRYLAGADPGSLASGQRQSRRVSPGDSGRSPRA